jgi:hypothetical protein
MSIVSKIFGIINGTNPANPPSGKRVLFAKSDGWYDKNSSGTVTKLVTSVDIDDTYPYMEYVFTYTQSGTAAPVVTVLRNTVGSDPVITRETTGQYRFQFPADTFAAADVISMAGFTTLDQTSSWKVLGGSNRFNLYTTSGQFETDADNVDNSIMVIRVQILK